MSGMKQLNDCLKTFSKAQVDTIAEMTASDCILRGFWEEYVSRFVIKRQWSPNNLQRAMVKRVSEISNDILTSASICEYDFEKSGEEYD